VAICTPTRAQQRPLPTPPPAFTITTTLNLGTERDPDMSVRDLEQCLAMARGYFAALLWTQPDYDADNESRDPMCDCGGCDLPVLHDSYDVDDVHPDDLAKMIAEFRALVDAHPAAVAHYRECLTAHVDASEGTTVWDQFGHDYLLTRDRHDTGGFGDRGLGEVGDLLTEIAHSAGEYDELAWSQERGALTSH